MIRCRLCASWFHEECVAIKCDADRGVWPCLECRHTSTRLKSLIDTVAQLVNAVTEIGVKLTSSEKAREEERAAAAAESAMLRQQNELLRCNVATLGEQMTTLTCKTFRPSGQPSSLLIGSSIGKKTCTILTSCVCARGADCGRSQPTGGPPQRIRQHHPACRWE